MENDFISIDKLNESYKKEYNEKIKKLKIPPNWTGVHISKNYSSKVQAYGFDSKKRKQYIYHPLWKMFSNNIKYSNNQNFNMDKLKKIIDKFKNYNDNSKIYVISNMLQIMIDLNIRVGNEIYLHDNDTIGLCTMYKSNLSNNKLIFKGKKGVIHEKILKTEHLKFIKNMLKIPGEFLFQYSEKQGEKQSEKQSENNAFNIISSNDINEFLKLHIDNNITTKDIRTYQANKIFIDFIKKNKQNYTNDKKLQVACLKHVANELGNTPKVCKDSYIDPNYLLIN